MDIPHASDRIHEWRNARARAGVMLVALDFDGTLVPIEDEAGDVRSSGEVRAVLESLEARADTRVAIISGRSLEDLEKRVALPGIVYAGNHGLEIRSPDFHLVDQSALAARPWLDRVGLALRGIGSSPAEGWTMYFGQTASGPDGVWVEDKGLTIAMHYRKARDPNAEQNLRRRVANILAGIPQLRVAEGKKIFEIVPAIAWDKGHALEWITKQLDIPGDAPVLFVGDDRTDEDAFRVVAAHGGGIIVADPPPTSTSASCFLRFPAEVIEFLKLLA